MVTALKEILQKDEEILLYKRVRISIDNIYRNEGYSKGLSQYLYSIKGIKEAKANPLTGRILVIFNEAIITQQKIMEEILRFETKTTKTSTIMPANEKCLQSKTTHRSNIIEESKTRTLLSRPSNPYHLMSTRYLEKVLKSDFNKGLGDQAVEAGLYKHGLNIISSENKSTLLSNIKEGLKDTCVKVLLSSSIVSLLLGQFVEAIALGGIVLFQVAIGAIQKSKSENSLDSLQNMLVQKTTVIRNGKKQEIDSKLLVPGDIILLQAGDKVPADARVLTSEYLMVNESSLSGESIGIPKTNKISNISASIANRHNILYMGTMIISGATKAVVIATGRNTEIGKIANILDNISQNTTQLEGMAEGFISKLIRIYLVLFALFGSLALFSGRGLPQVLMMGVTFFLGAIPEGLPVTVTTSMVLSVRRMAKKNAIVRRLSAVENLGSVDVICCDKTGTLTVNEMTVREIYAADRLYTVTGVGYDPKGSIVPTKGNNDNYDSLERLLRAGVLCNNSSLIMTNNRWEVQGDPTEGALLAAAIKRNLNLDGLKASHTCLKEYPFDSKNGFMLSIVKCTRMEEIYAYCKGSIEAILERCSYIYENGTERPLTIADKEKITDYCNGMAEKALRTLAFSYKKLNSTEDETDEGLVFLGIVGMEDPPREGVRESIRKCHRAGIRVVMITGDHVETARAIGKQLNILTDGIVVNGRDLEQMDDNYLNSIISKVQVFARTTPEQKYRIVKALKYKGHIVAMTGDGVNDAPAIKEAHVGIAMGMKGSDVAREAACITLIDDDFSTIVAAIEEGRGVIQNIRNTLKYLFAGAIGEMLAILLAFMSGMPAPFLALQMIWINLISETLLGSSLAIEPPPRDILIKPNKKKQGRLIDKELRNSIIRRGLGIGMSTFVVFIASTLFGANIAMASTLAFSCFILSQIINLKDSRHNKAEKATKYMRLMTGITITSLIAIVYIPFLNTIFGTVPIGLSGIAGLAGAILLGRL